MANNSDAQWTERALQSELRSSFRDALSEAKNDGYTDAKGDVPHGSKYTKTNLRSAYAKAGDKFTNAAASNLSECVASAIEERDDDREHDENFNDQTEPTCNANVTMETNFEWVGDEGEGIDTKESTIDCTAEFTIEPWGTKSVAKKSYSLHSLR